jgi:uncharacterized protein (DUF927 family)
LSYKPAFRHDEHKQSALKQFLTYFHGLASNTDGELVLTTITQVGNNTQIRNFRFPVGDLEGMVARAIEEANKPGTNVYFGSYVLKPGVVTGNRRGERDDILAVLMLGVDQDADHGREGVLPLSPNFTIRTSVTTRSDGSEAINRQSFYVFDPATRPSVAEAATLGRALREFTGADTATGDIVRLYRVPGTWNWPSPSKIDRGRSPEPQLVVVEQEATGFVDLDELWLQCAKAGRVREESEPAYAGEVADLLHRASPRLRRALNRHDIDGDRSSAAWSAIASAMEEGFSDAEIEPLVLAHPRGVGERYLDDQKSLRDEITRARAKTIPRTDDADDDDLPDGFHRAADGCLFYRRTGKSGEALCVPFCSPLRVIARARDHDENNWGRIVEIKPPQGENRRLYLAASDLHVTSGDRDPLARLASAGLEIYEPSDRNRLRKILAHPIDRYARVVRRTGWHHGTFILPHKAIGASNDELHVWDGDESHEHAFRPNGTLEEWQSQIAEPIQGHPLLILAMSMAFVGPCLRLADYPEDFGLNLYGPSSRGKTTALDIAASVWGSPDRFSRTWRGTSNGFESIAAARNDTLLVLDELRQVNSQDLSACVYMLSQGRGKQRANRSGDARRTHEWRLGYLSSGETSIADHLRSAPNQRPMAGQHIRCLEVPLPDEGQGIFDHVAAPQTAAELAQTLKHCARTTYGTAGPAYINGIAKDLARACNRLQELSDQFHQVGLSTPEMAMADGQVQRALGHFSMIYAAGALACESSVLPFPSTRILDAVRLGIQAWINMRGGYGCFEEERAVTAIREFIELHPSRFQSGLADVDGHAPRERAGVKITKDGRLFYAILPGIWKNEVCQGLNPQAVAKIALQQGFLEPERDAHGEVSNLQRKVTLDGCRPRAYWISATILGEEAVDQAPDEGDDDGIVRSMDFLKRTKRRSA